MFHKRKETGRSAAIEIYQTRLNLVVSETREDGTVAIQSESVAWRRDAVSLRSEQGQAELAGSLKELAARYRLSGVPVFLILNGDYSVTRVVTGSSKRVRHELAQLQDRSALYISLGHGQKAIAVSVRQIDARNEHALLTVVNQETLDFVVGAAVRANLDVQVIEPSLVSLSRLAGHVDQEIDSPVLIVNLGDRGGELGISHRGQLLLDYRPAMWEGHDQVVDIVSDHLSRLQRYCDRYVRFAQGKLENVYLCGRADLVQSVEEGFRRYDALRVRRLDLTADHLGWSFPENVPGPDMHAALGACMLGHPGGSDVVGPNLMEHVRSQTRDPIGPQLVRAFWPLAAAMLLAVGTWSTAHYEESRCDELAVQLALYEPKQRRALALQHEIVDHRQRTELLQEIDAALLHPAWHEVTRQIGACLPDDVWLDTIQVDDHGRMKLSGASDTDDGGLAFVSWLRDFPRLERVALSETRATRLNTGPATRFDVSCELAGSNDQKEMPDDNG